MVEKNEIKQVTETKELKLDKKTKEEITKDNSKAEIELITAYAQLVFHTLKHSSTEINAKSIREEVKMFYEKFGNKEVKRLASVIMKEKRRKNKMLKYLIFSMISFLLGVFAKEIIEIYERNQRYKKVKKLCDQDFKKAMKDLEIK